MKRKKRKTEWVPWGTMPMAELINWVEMYGVIESSQQLLHGKPDWTREWERLEMERPQWERDLFAELDAVQSQAKAAAGEWIGSGKVTSPQVPPLFASHGRNRYLLRALLVGACASDRCSAPHESQAWLAMIPREAARLITRIQIRFNQKAKEA